MSSNEDDDYEVILSPLSYKHVEGDKSVVVEIYRGEDEKRWILEILDIYGNSLIGDELFDTEQQALDEFKKDLKKEGIDYFIRKPQ